MSLSSQIDKPRFNNDLACPLLQMRASSQVNADRRLGVRTEATGTRLPGRHRTGRGRSFKPKLGRDPGWFTSPPEGGKVAAKTNPSGTPETIRRRMRLSWNEIRARAGSFVRKWADAGYERGETQTFYNDFFLSLGHDAGAATASTVRAALIPSRRSRVGASRSPPRFFCGPMTGLTFPDDKCPATQNWECST